MATEALTSETHRAAGGRGGLDAAQTARFDSVVRRSGARLIRMLDFVFLDRELAADAAQEAFVQLYLHWHEVGASAEPEAWLYRVAVNRGRDHRRRLARAARLLRRMAALSSGDLETGSWDTTGWEQDDELIAALRRLPVKQRTAAALFYQADLSIADVALTMGISEGAVNSHLNRARRALRQILEVAS